MKRSIQIIVKSFLLTAALFSFAACDNTANTVSTTEISQNTASETQVTSFHAYSGNAKVTLTWTNPASSSLSGLTIKRGTSSTNLTELANPTTSTTSYVDSNVENDTTYYYSITASFSDDTEDTVTDIISSTPTSETSISFVENLKIGWNLGNTLDAPTETEWGMPTTTQAMITAVKNAGFNTIRIPVSWSKHITDSSNYTIDTTWMNRVKVVVDYAYNQGMYVILNVHHDNYSTDSSTGLASSSIYGYAITTDSTLQTKSKNYLNKVWTQIATTFASYDNKLIFELLNEPRTVGETTEWYINDTTTATTYNNIITNYENTCISAIRAVSGNENRFLMVPPYAASGTMTVTLSTYTMPTDTASDKLILSVHAYSPYNFAMYSANDANHTSFTSSDQSSLDSIFSYLKTNYTDNNIAVVMGEASASDKNNTSERISWANYYFGKAKNAGIPVVLWDNQVTISNGGNLTSGECHGWLNRTACKWYFPTIIQAMMDTVGVTGYSIPEYVEPTTSSIGWDEDSAITITPSDAGALAWGTSANTLSSSNFSNAQAGSILKITFTASGAAIKLINSSWTPYSSGTIVNGSSNSDSVITASSTDLYYVLTSSDASAWKSNNIYIAGQNGTVSAVKFLATPASN
ncbi:MAG: glycoside hydrolase family 5 protein [Treponema sp.]|nr:glycoside hydrolase family 5 protein [Treponema sp.]